MPSVDDRIVAIKFDNREFEKNIATTIESINKLKTSVDTVGQGKGLQDIAVADKAFKLDGMSSAIDTISAKFSTMQAVAFGAISSIASMAVTKGAEIIKGLSLGPINSGFEEYETGINSVQTILGNTASKGTVLSDVEAQLDVLNDYADKTIYNFGQMTKAAGTFTAAGLGLNEATAAVKGISNLAGLSGASAEQASGAYVQLGQAMSGAGLRAQDWLSVNAAGLGGEAFKTSLFETAKAMGTLTNSPVGETFQEWTDRGNDFKDAMGEGVFTSDVLQLSLQSFTGDLTAADLAAKGFTEDQISRIMATAEQAKSATTDVKTFTQLMSTTKESIGSGWSATMKIILGNFDEAKQLFSGLYVIFNSIIGRLSDGRNQLLGEWKEMGGREAMIQSLRNVMWALASVIGTVHKAFRDAFPKTTGAELTNFSQKVEHFTKMLIPSEQTLISIGKVFGGFFSILSIGWEVIKKTLSVFSDLFGLLSDGVGGAGGGILEWFGNIGQSVIDLKATLVDGGGIAAFFDRFIRPVVGMIQNLDLGGKIQAVIDKFKEVKNQIQEMIKVDPEGVFASLREAFESFKKFLGSVFNRDMSPATDAMGDATGRLQDRWESFMKIGEKLGNFFDKLEEIVKPTADLFKNFFDKLAETFKSGDYSGLHDALNTVLMGGILGVFIKFIKDGGVKIELFGNWFGKGGKFTQMAQEFTGVFKALQLELKANVLKQIAISIAILVASMVVISLIDSSKLSIALFTISAGMGELVAALVTLDKHADKSSPQKLLALAGSLVLVALAVLILAFATKKLGEMKPEELAIGVMGIAALLLGLVVFVNALQDMIKHMPKDKDIGDMIKVGIAIVIMAFGIGKMADAVKDLAELDFWKMMQGLLGVALILAVVTVALKHMPGKKQTSSVAVFAAGLWLMTKVIEQLGEMNLKVLAQGLASVAITLALVAIVLDAMPDDALAKAASLLVVAAAMLIMKVAIEQMAGMEITTLLNGMLKIAGILLVLGFAMRFMEGTVEGAAAMAIVVAGLFFLAEVVKRFNDVGWGGILMMAAALAILALAIFGITAASDLLSESTPFILAFGIALQSVALAFLLLGAGVLLTGIGVLALVGGVFLLAKISKEGLEDIIKILPKLGVAIGEAFAGFIIALLKATPEMLRLFGNAVHALMEMLRKTVPEVITIGTALIDAIIETVQENLPKIQEAGYELLRRLLKGVLENIGSIVDLVSDIIIRFENSLADKMPALAASGARLLISFLDGIRTNLPQVIEAVKLLILVFLIQIDKSIDPIIAAGHHILDKLIDGLVGLGIMELIRILDGIRKIKDAIIFLVPEFVDVGFELLIGIIDGFIFGMTDENNLSRLKEAASILGKVILSGLPFMSGKFDAEINAYKIKVQMERVMEAMRKGAEANSPSKKSMELGKDIMIGLAMGITQNANQASAAAEATAQEVLDAMNPSIFDFSSLLDGLGEFQPTIAPIFDMTSIEDGAANMNSLFQDPTLSLGTSFNSANSLAASQNIGAFAGMEPFSTGPTINNTTFEQTINSPTQLNASDIYRQTKSQIALAQEELNV